MIFLLLSMLASQVQAQSIELRRPTQFSQDEKKIVETLNSQLKFTTPIHLAKLPADESRKRIFTTFDPRTEDATTYLTTDIADPLLFASVVCHELGHVMGAGPIPKSATSRRQSWVPKYTPLEGQGDYFAATKCIPLLKDVLPKVEANPLCANLADKDRCSLVLAAGKKMTNYIVTLGLKRKGQEVVESNLPNYGAEPVVPNPEATYVVVEDPVCRLQTWQAGAMCELSPSIQFSASNEDDGACVAAAGARPRCWYVRGTEVRKWVDGN